MVKGSSVSARNVLKVLPMFVHCAPQETELIGLAPPQVSGPYEQRGV